LDKKLEADDLLAEITGGSLANPSPLTIETETDTNENHSHDNASYLSNEAETVKNEDMPTPPDPTPQNFPNCMPDSMHSIPDKQIHSISETPPLSSQNAEGEGVSNFWEQFEEPAIETPPLVDSGSPTPPVDISNPNWREV
jgi:hypothetical protein